MALERLDKIIASCTAYSRREVKILVKRGAVLVDGAAARFSDMKIDPQTSAITVNGTRIAYQKFIYVMLNKPAGVVSSTEEKGMTTVLDLVDDEIRRRGVFPAGRLDRDTTGFVLLTDDGAFAHDILSPSNHVTKTYILTAAHKLTDAQAAEMTWGFPMDGELLLPSALRLVKDDLQPVYEIKIRQGKYHQIKRMFAHFDNQVLALRRVAIGGLSLDPDLQAGAYRELTPEEKNSITVENNSESR